MSSNMEPRKVQPVARRTHLFSGSLMRNQSLPDGAAAFKIYAERYEKAEKAGASPRAA